MMEAVAPPLRTLAGRRQQQFYGKHYHNDSTTNSLHSSSNNSSSLLLSNRSSLYALNIERQLHSLVIEDEDTQEDTAELLQKTFDQLDVESHHHQYHHLHHHHLHTGRHHVHHSSQLIRLYGSLLTSPSFNSSISNSTSCKSSSMHYDDDESSPLFLDASIFFFVMQDFSAFTSPFTEQPVIVGRHSGYYIPSPTSIRNYLDYPGASILKAMKLSYPFRVKEPVSQRMDRLDSNSSFISMLNTRQRSQQRRKKSSVGRRTSSQPHQPIKPSKRHSLAMGQVDQILRENSVVVTDTLLKPTSQDILLNHRYPLRSSRASVAESMLSDQATQDIMTWMPDQHTVWQDWMNDEDVPSLRDSPTQNDVPRLHIPCDDDPGSLKAQLHPLETAPRN